MVNTAIESGTTLVLGGTGKTGRRVAERLEARGLPVRIGSRTGETPFEWNDPETWAPLLVGIDSVYVTYQPDLAFPGAAETVGAFARLAVSKGVRRIVLLSGRNEEGALRGEQAVRESGAEWTVVRSSFMNQNFSESFWLDPILEGELAFPAGDVAEPFIDVDDIADVVVAALTEDGHAGQVYEVTGPRLMTFAEAVGEIGRASARDISYLPVTAEQYEAGMLEAQVPADVAAGLSELFGEVLDGRSAHTADGVQRALGREPRDFVDFAKDVAATGIWNGGAR